MRIIRVRPVESQTIISSRCEETLVQNRLLVGRVFEKSFVSKLVFPLEGFYGAESAILKLACIGTPRFGLPVCAGDKNNCLCVEDPGEYQWNVTRLLETGGDFLEIRLFAKNTRLPAQTAEFGVSGSELIIKTAESPIIVDKKEILPSGDFPGHTSWIDTKGLAEFYYFIKNEGPGGVSVLTEISPDKTLVYEDTNRHTIGSGEVYYTMPLRQSRYVRIRFENAAPSESGSVLYWFQGKI